jgi:ATP-dependent DNA helicase RecG
MTDQEIAELLADQESDRVERKASLSNKSDISKAICAFANDLPNRQEPGVVFVGIHEDGSCADNFAPSDENLRELADIRSNGNIVPFPSMAVQKKTIAGCDLATVIVQPSDAPPVRYKGRVWIRVGPRRDVASDEEERRLNEKRRAHDLSFDLRPLPSADLDELDLDLFEREYIPSLERPTSHENGRSIEEQLASVRFTTPGPEFTPTVLGVLTVGIDPRRFVPGAYVQFLRVDGTELGDPIKDQSEIDGPLPEMLSRLDEKMRAHLEVSSDFVSGDREEQHQNYPLPALQQLARNAVLHRDYDSTGAPVRITWFSDRIEINNPGGPYGQVTRENFGQPGVTDYRNPHLAEVMKNLGYVQRFGAGIPTARRVLEENGNPLPKFTIDDSYVLVTIRREP